MNAVNATDSRFNRRSQPKAIVPKQPISDHAWRLGASIGEMSQVERPQMRGGS